MNRLLLACVCCAATLSVAAQQPLYFVNGTPADDIASIPPDDIELVEELPADEETIARFGPRASNGVILITLRYDEPARFAADSLPVGNYTPPRGRWEAHEPAARVVLRYRITAEGQTIVEDELESTDNRLKRRVLKAVEEAPRWRPARKNGRAVESEGVLRIQLPEGKRMPRQIELVIR